MTNNAIKKMRAAEAKPTADFFEMFWEQLARIEEEPGTGQRLMSQIMASIVMFSEENSVPINRDTLIRYAAGEFNHPTHSERCKAMTDGEKEAGMKRFYELHPEMRVDESTWDEAQQRYV